MTAGTFPPIGTLSFWRLCDPGSEPEPAPSACAPPASTAPIFLCEVSFSMGDADAGGLLGHALLATSLRGAAPASLSVAVGCAGCVHGCTLEAAAASDDVANVLGNPASWVDLGPPGAEPAAAAAAPLLQLALVPSAAAQEGAQAHASSALALVGGGLPALWSKPIGSPAGPPPPAAAPSPLAAGGWTRLAIDADDEAAMTADDDPIFRDPAADSEPDARTEWYLSRLLLPARFSPRHLASTTHALLPDYAVDEAAGWAPARLRDGMGARLAELEAQARATGVPKARGELEVELGDSMLAYARDQKMGLHEILGLASLSPPGTWGGIPGGAGDADGPCAMLLITRARLEVLQPLPRGGVVGGGVGGGTSALPALSLAASKLDTHCLDAASGSNVAWSRLVLPSAAREPACAVGSASRLLAAARAARGEAHAAIVRDTHALLAQQGQYGAGGARGAARLLHSNLSAAPRSGEDFDPIAWHKQMRDAWAAGGATPAAEHAAHSRSAHLASAVGLVATRGAAACRGSLLQLLVGIDGGAAACAPADRAACVAAPHGELHALSRLTVGYELLAWLASAAPPSSAALGPAAMHQLLRAAPLPKGPAAPLLDGGPCARALLSFVLADLAMAHSAEAAPPAAAATAPWPSGMASLLCGARMWGALAAYLARLGSSHPVHRMLGGIAELRLEKHAAAADSFRAAAAGASTATLVGLLAEAGAPPTTPEAHPPADPAEENQWALFGLHAAFCRAFREAADAQLCLDFATLALATPILPRVAPRQCASLCALILGTALELGMVDEAHKTLVALDGHASRARDAMPPAAQLASPRLRAKIKDSDGAALAAAEATLCPPESCPFESARLDCMRLLISTLYVGKSLPIHSAKST